MTNSSDHQKERLAAVGQAALNMSHGIKNIVQSMRSGSDVMEEALSRNNIDVARRTWNILSQNIERIQKLSLDMLRFSKAEPPCLQPSDLNRLVSSVVESIRPQADRQQTAIITRFSQHLEPAAVDPEQIQDVILNLLINALEAVSPQSGEIHVETEIDRARPEAVLRVSDNGPGIENAHIIFEPFYSSKGGVNAGLGLTVARDIISRHGGTIEALSKPGHGSVFSVHIPLQPLTP